MSTPTRMSWTTATDIGGRERNADATATATAPDGTVAVAVMDGIGTHPDTVAAVVIAAEVAARVGARRGALAGMLAAGELISSGTADNTTPNAVGVLAVTYPDGQTVIAHCGDTRAYTWDGTTLTPHTTDHTLAQMLRQAGHHTSHTTFDDGVRTTLARATVASITTTQPVTAPLVILTSDGVHKPLPDSEITRIVTEHQTTPDTLAAALVTAALDHHHGTNPADNATAAVLHITTRTPDTTREVA